jgi:thioredoxin-dependent peroxiredoxin
MGVSINKKVPAFSLPATGGEELGPAQYLGQKLVIYFYPKDNTPGCTQEGQDFRDLYPKFKKAGTAILGISRDSIRSHDNFKEKYKFPFPLLSDSKEIACKLFDVIQEKNMYGRKVMGIQRSTFLLDDKGILRQEWRGVTVKGHASEVLEAAKAL